MKPIWPISLITFKEGLRHRVLFGVLIAALLLIFFAIFMSGLFMRDLLKIILDICLSAISIGGLLVPFFLAVNLLARDIEKNTIYTILAQPVSRGHYILGRFFGLALLTGAIMMILTAAALLSIYGATFIYPARFFSDFSLPPILLSSLITFLGILVLNSTVLLWCSVTTSSFLATLLTLSTYVIGQSSEDLVRFMSVRSAEVHISPIVQSVVKVVLYIFPNLAAFDIKQLAAHGITITFQEISLLVTYGFAYSTVMLTLAVFFFKKRDLP